MAEFPQNVEYQFSPSLDANGDQQGLGIQGQSLVIVNMCIKHCPSGSTESANDPLYATNYGGTA